MTVSLNNKFLLNSRGYTFEDSTSIAWTFNATTNELTATALSASAATSLAGGASGSLPYQSAPNVTAFLAAGSNGSLLTLAAGVPAWEAVPTWNQSTTGTAANVTGVVVGTNGGTGVNNGASTLTYAGNVTFAGAHTFTATITATTSVTFPLSGTLATTSQIPASANPSASIGLAAVNGTAATFMTSDSAPALSVAITPTWSGLHKFAGTVQISASGSSTSLTVTAPNTANIFGGYFIGGASAGSSNGIFVQAGVGSSSDRIIDVFNLAETQRLFGLFGDGSGQIGYNGSTGTIKWAAGGAVTMSNTFAINGGTPTAQLSGFGTPSGTPTASLTNASTLAQTAGTLAALLAYLKTIGFIAV